MKITTTDIRYTTILYIDGKLFGHVITHNAAMVSNTSILIVTILKQIF